MFVALFVLLGASSAFADNSTEVIDNYNVSVVIDKDATISVTETIKYNFGQNSKHGIYRTIPYKYKARGGSLRLEIDDVGVTDESGNSYTYE